MIFNNFQPIYIQIVEVLKMKIVQSEWHPGERIPSVRDTAVELVVNPNTVMRAYERLQRDEIIFNKRGLGYFLSLDAPSKVLESRRKEFEENELPDLFEKMRKLRITQEDLVAIHNKWLSSNK